MKKTRSLAAPTVAIDRNLLLGAHHGLASFVDDINEESMEGNVEDKRQFLAYRDYFTAVLATKAWQRAVKAVKCVKTPKNSLK